MKNRLLTVLAYLLAIPLYLVIGLPLSLLGVAILTFLYIIYGFMCTVDYLKKLFGLDITYTTNYTISNREEKRREPTR